MIDSGSTRAQGCFGSFKRTASCQGGGAASCRQIQHMKSCTRGPCLPCPFLESIRHVQVSGIVIVNLHLAAGAYMTVHMWLRVPPDACHITKAVSWMQLLICAHEEATRCLLLMLLLSHSSAIHKGKRVWAASQRMSATSASLGRRISAPTPQNPPLPPPPPPFRAHHIRYDSAHIQPRSFNNCGAVVRLCAPHHETNGYMEKAK